MKKKRLYTIIAAAILIILIGGYMAGYKLDNLKLERSASIYLTVPYSGSTIFVDNKEYKSTRSDNETVAINRVDEGTRNIIVAHPERWPWTKNIKVSDNNEYYVESFNLKQNTDIEIIPNDAEEYGVLKSEIEQTKNPTKENPAVSSDTKVSMYVEGSTVYVTWNGTANEAPAVFCQNKQCMRTVPLISLVTDIKSAALYPNDRSKVILAADQSISVLEIAPTGNQNFQYIVNGQNPRFVLKDDKLFISDNDALGVVNLE